MKSHRQNKLLATKTLQQSGMSLIEVLIAILVLSVGLLAMAGIHATSLKLTQVNKYRLVATEVAQSFSESVKANSSEAIPPRTGYVTLAAGGANNQPNPMCNAVAAVICTPAQIAAIDLFNARQSARTLLPSGDIFTQLIPAPAAANNTTPTLAVWVYWANPQVVANAAVATQLEATCPAAVLAINPQLSCVQFVVSL